MLYTPEACNVVLNTLAVDVSRHLKRYTDDDLRDLIEMLSGPDDEDLEEVGEQQRFVEGLASITVISELRRRLEVAELES